MNVNGVIFEITRTAVPSFTDGVFKSPWKGGFKVKATSGGTLSVRYAGDLKLDANAPWRVLSVNGTNTWDLPDRIAEIRDHADTTLDLSNVLVGTHDLD